MKFLGYMVAVCALVACTKEVRVPESTTAVIPEAAMGGDRVGNGGGVWACEEKDGTIRSIELVDLFEAREEFGLSIPDTHEFKLTFLDLVQFKREWIFKHDPYLFYNFDRNVRHVLEQINFVNGDLKVIEDSLYRVQPAPESCAGGTVRYRQLANFTNYGKVIIDSRLWNHPKFSEDSKAALIFHEAFYKWLRDKAGDKNSIRARALTGYIYSSLFPLEMRPKLNEVLYKWGVDPRDSKYKEIAPPVFRKGYVKFERLTGPGSYAIANWSMIPEYIKVAPGPNGQWNFLATVTKFRTLAEDSEAEGVLKLIDKSKPQALASDFGFELKLPSGETCSFDLHMDMVLTANGSELWMKWPYSARFESWVLDGAESVRPATWKCDDFEIRTFRANILSLD